MSLNLLSLTIILLTLLTLKTSKMADKASFSYTYSLDWARSHMVSTGFESNLTMRGIWHCTVVQEAVPFPSGVQ